MNSLPLRNSMLAALFCLAAYAPTSSAIVKHPSVKGVLGIGAPTVTVDFSDLDVARGAGVEILYQRLRSAAKAVCGSKDMRDLSGMQECRKCYDSALDRAVKNVDNERLNQIHNG